MRTFESSPPLKVRLLFEEMATQKTKLSCLVFIWWPLEGESTPSVPWLRDHNRTDLSPPPDTKYLPSHENFIVKILSVWPGRPRLWNDWICCLDLAEQLEANEETRRLAEGCRRSRATDSANLAFAAEAFFLFFLDTPTGSWMSIRKPVNIRRCVDWV